MDPTMLILVLLRPWLYLLKNFHVSTLHTHEYSGRQPSRLAAASCSLSGPSGGALFKNGRRTEARAQLLAQLNSINWAFMAPCFSCSMHWRCAQRGARAIHQCRAHRMATPPFPRCNGVLPWRSSSTARALYARIRPR